MASLAEVYEGVGRNVSLRRLYLGVALFGAGAVMVIIAILLAATDLVSVLGFGTYEARHVAGVFAGVGIPAVFLGIFSVLPASPRERATAAIGASIAIFGVVLFWEVYPDQWYGATADHLTLPVVVVYFIGAILTFWSLFTAVVNFKIRNDPGGTVTIKRTVAGRTEYIEVPRSELGGTLSDIAGVGGVGVVGDVDRRGAERESPGWDAEVMTDDGRRGGREGGGTAPASDGGTTTDGIRSPEPTTDAVGGGGRSNPDRYCGSCSQFDYVRTDRGIQPYCGHYDELMDDMDPCEHWEPRTR